MLKTSLCVAITMPSVRVSLPRISHTTSPTLGDKPTAFMIFVSTEIISPKFGERFVVRLSFCFRFSIEAILIVCCFALLSCVLDIFAP